MSDTDTLSLLDAKQLAAPLSVTSNSEPLLITADKVCELLSVSRRHLETLANSGRLPRPVKLGRCRRWRREEIEAWISSGCPAIDRWEASRGKAERK